MVRFETACSASQWHSSRNEDLMRGPSCCFSTDLYSPYDVLNMNLVFLRRWSRPAKYAALNYSGTTNLGDEIQTIAALRFLPRVDTWVNRERLDEFSSDAPHKIILNGWFLHRPEHWPPSRYLRPLIISFHLTREVHAGFNELMMAPKSTVLSPDGVKYLRRHEPIGARDLDTFRQLRAAGLRAYFSGCLTLTLRMPEPVPRDGKVYAVDVSDEVFAHFSGQSDVPITRLTHVDAETVGDARFEKARSLLRKYAAARAVVTGGLHCALPCLALGSPVLFVETASDSYRFEGLRNLLHHTSEEHLFDDRCQFDLRSPPPNGNEWRSLRDQLEARCEGFLAGR